MAFNEFTIMSWPIPLAISLSIFAIPLKAAESVEIRSCPSISLRRDALPEELRDRHPSKVITECVDDLDEAGQSTVAVVSYDGPPRGVMFVVNRTGKISPAEEVGSPMSISTRRLRGGGVLVTIEGTVGTGTGVREDQFTVFQVHDGHVTRLWRGLAYRLDAPGVGAKSLISIRRGVLSFTEGPDGKTVLLDHVIFSEAVSAGGVHTKGSKPHIVVDRRETLKLK